MCVLVTERKVKLLQTWRLLQEVLRLCEEQAEWLRTQTQTLDTIQSQASSMQLLSLPTHIAACEVRGFLYKVPVVN